MINNKPVLLAILLLLLPRGIQAEEKPPGDCTANRHAELKAAVGRACKSGSMKCSGPEPCLQLQANWDQFQACIDAREAIAQECFKGGDAKHRDAIQDYKNGANKCRQRMIEKNCPNTPEICQ